MPDAVIQPLEVFILDSDFKRLTGSIPYDSLIWRRRYYGVGEFQMQVRSSLYSTDWAYVYCEDRPETGIIQKVEYDDTTEGPRNGEDTVIISGFFLEEVLNRLVFLVEETETQEIKHVVPKPTRLSVSKPQFKQDADGNIYTIWKNGIINNCMTGEAARVEDSQDLIAGLTDSDVQPGKGIYEHVFNAGQGDYTVGLYSSNYSYVSEDGKLHVLDARDETQASFDIVGDPSSGLILYKDTDGSTKWVNGAVESYEDTYRRKTQRWEQLAVDEDGNRYYMEYRTVKGPWMLRTDIDDVTTAQDNVEWVIKMAQRAFQGNFIYDEPGFEGEVKTLSPSLSRIGDFFYKELQSVEAGLRVLYDFPTDQIVFQVWRGLDRTQDGGGQTPVELMAASAEPDVPIGYEKLEYIQSAGTQYIKLDFTPDSDTRVVLDHQLTDKDGTYAMLGSRTSTTSTDIFCVFVVNGQIRTDYAANEHGTFTATTSRETLDKDGRVTTYNGQTSTLGAATFTCPRPMALFSVQNVSGTSVFDDQVDNRPVKMRLYSCKIYDGDALARDLVPARRQQDSAVGLYDTVTGTFYGNSGTGSFVAGPVVSVADSLTYDPNGGEGSMDPTPGYVGDAVVVEANGFTRDGHTFRVWNTQSDGGGTDYAPLSEYTLTAGADVLFAQWDEVPEPPVPVPEGVGVPWAVFSDTWGTLYGFTASHDTSNYRNKCYILYDYEEPVWNASGGVDVHRVQVDDDGDGVYDRWTNGTSGTVRRRGYWTVRLEDDRPDAEVWLDLRGESPDFMEGLEFPAYDAPSAYDITSSDFEKWVEGLKTRGRTLLTSDYGDVDNLDTGTISTMRYLYDFDLGDKVDMAVEAIGMVKTARITEVEEVYESGSAEIHLTMGEELLTTDKKSILV